MSAPFRLLDLPAELRLSIYSRILSNSISQSLSQQLPSVPSLCSVSRQILAEIGKVYIKMLASEIQEVNETIENLRVEAQAQYHSTYKEMVAHGVDGLHGLWLLAKDLGRHPCNDPALRRKRTRELHILRQMEWWERVRLQAINNGCQKSRKI